MSEKKKDGLNIELSEEIAEGKYSNLAIINHSPSEFILDFIQMIIFLNLKIKMVKLRKLTIRYQLILAVLLLKHNVFNLKKGIYNFWQEQMFLL